MNSSEAAPPARSSLTPEFRPEAQRPPNWKAAFGPFLLVPEERLLQRSGVPVRLGGRALDLLIALVDSAGSVVGKKELIKRVWGNIHVEEGSLRFNMYAVRRALGDGVDGARYIVNMASKGYCFVAEIDRRVHAQAPRADGPRRARSLPALPTSLVGRDGELSLIESSLVQRRLVSIVGAGGIGKTTVAIASAQRVAGQFAGDVCYVDLCVTADATLVRAAIAGAAGLESDLGDLSAISAHIGDRRLLLVLDCCEHVISDAAEITEYLMRNCSRVHVLATSREPLRADGEFVYRLQPLACPSEGEGTTAIAALAFPAVRLFVERAASNGTEFNLKDGDAALVSQLCRELDGIPLAIELAAGRIEALGLQGVMSDFDARMTLMWHGRRTAVSRHQTLRATLDWSFRLLDTEEARLLSRLSVFAGTFSLEAAVEICGFDFDLSDAIELIAGLVSKSLVSVDAGGISLRYGLLDTTKAYCWERLSDAGESDAVARRFCSHFNALAQGQAARVLGRHELEALALDLPNLRTALEWSLGRPAETLEAVKLAGALCPLLLQLSKLTECVHWASSAISAMPPELKATRVEMHLQAALGQSLMFTGGDVDGAEAALRRGISLAESLCDHHGELHLLSGYSVLLHREGRFNEALAVARRAERLLPEVDEPEAAAIVDSLLGVALYFVGKSEQALHHWQRSVAYGARALTDATFKLGFDRHIVSLCGAARALRLAGDYARAFEVAEDTVAKSRSFGHVVTHCIALLWAGSMYTHHADIDRLKELMDELESVARRHALAPYMTVAAATRGQILVFQGNPGAGVERIRLEVERLRASRFEVLSNVFLTTMAQGLADLSLHSAAIATCDDVERRIEVGGDLLRLPELRLTKGRVLAASGNFEAAMESYAASLKVARDQGSRPGQLRAVLAIAQLLIRDGHLTDAHALIRPEVAAAGDQASPDLTRARSLLKISNKT